MRYIVTSHGSDGHKPAFAAVDMPTSKKEVSLEDALARAVELLSKNEPNVAIQDGNGKSISGDDLVACRNGLKNLTPDLRAVPK